MIGQIGYLGQVSPRVGLASAALYLVGTSAGAFVLGAGLGSVGLGARWLLDLGDAADAPVLIVVLGVLAVLGGLTDLGLLPFSLPQPTRQLPRHWLAVLGPYWTGLLWGLHVGVGRHTRVGYAMYYVLLAWIVLAGRPALGGLVLATYGLAHGVLLLMEVAGIACGKLDLLGGLLGVRRAELFFPFTGGTQLACGLLLLGQVVGR